MASVPFIGLFKVYQVAWRFWTAWVQASRCMLNILCLFWNRLQLHNNHLDITPNQHMTLTWLKHRYRELQQNRECQFFRGHTYTLAPLARTGMTAQGQLASAPWRSKRRKGNVSHHTMYHANYSHIETTSICVRCTNTNLIYTVYRKQEVASVPWR